MKFSHIVGGALVLALAFPAAAQQATRKGIRGVVAAIDGQTLRVKGKDGQLTTVTLTPDWKVRVLEPISVDAIHAGSFIGTAQMPQPDGSGRSLEVHVFPPGVKSGEGERAWDSKPGSRMTNGTVEGEVTSDAKGREVTLAFPSGSRKITIPPGTPIVQFGPGRRAEIKPGVAVFVVAQAAADGSWKSDSVSIGQNGAAPPM